MKKKQNSRKLLIIALVILSVLLAALLGLAIYLNQSGTEEPGTEPSDQQTQGESAPTTAPEGETTMAPATDPAVESTTEPEDMTISTKFGDHTYPGKWANQVRTEVKETGDGGYVTYYGTVNGKEAVLFTVHYGKAPENSFPIGTMKVDGVSLAVSVEMSEFEPDSSWTEEEADTIRAMQEGLNDVIAHLKKDKAFTSGTGEAPGENTGSAGSTEPKDPEKPTSPTEGTGNTEDPDPVETTAPVTAEDLTVSTKYAELVFPAQWADQIRTETEEMGIGYAVTFYGTVGGKEAELFTVFFAAESENSFPVGILSVDGVAMDVCIEVAEVLSDGSWTTAQMDTISAMQESVNYMIEKLQETTDFEPLQ